MNPVTGIFIVMLAGIASGTISAVAKAIGRHAGSRAVLDELTGLVRQHDAELEEARATQASHAQQLAELHERVDFAERMLAQAKERKGIGGAAPAEPAPSPPPA